MRYNYKKILNFITRRVGYHRLHAYKDSFSDRLYCLELMCNSPRVYDYSDVYLLEGSLKKMCFAYDPSPCSIVKALIKNKDKIIVSEPEGEKCRDGLRRIGQIGMPSPLIMLLKQSDTLESLAIEAELSLQI